MTLEHVPDPLNLVLQCRRLLIPGGMLALVTHSHRALINRLLGCRSPIIDIEHLQLFDIDSLRFLLHAQGFQGVVVSPLRNTYCINYWERLLPLPRVLHKVLQRVFTVSRLGERKISLNVGNIFSVGWR